MPDPNRPPTEVFRVWRGHVTNYACSRNAPRAMKHGSCIMESFFAEATLIEIGVYVVVNFLSQVIFLFLLFLGTVMYANGVETKEK